MSHFTSFTPEGMAAFRQTLNADAAQRREFVAALFSNERRRRNTAAQNADTRRLFVSELRSGVHALRNRFELARRDMVADFQQMASELRSARQSFQNRGANPPQRPNRTPYPPSAPRPRAPEHTAFESVKPASTHAASTHSPATHNEKPRNEERHAEKAHDDRTDAAKKRHA
jgi:hypothetical protein